MSQTTCISCGRLIPVGSGGRCQIHKPMQRRVRSSAAWTRMSRQVRAAGSCAYCGAMGVPLQAHHVMAAATHPDMILDPGNVLPACARCHKRLTRQQGVDVARSRQ